MSYIKDHQIEKAVIEKIELPQDIPEDEEDTKDARSREAKTKDTKPKEKK